MTSKAALDKSKAVLLPVWTRLAADPGSVPDFGLVIGALAPGRLIEYEVVTDRVVQGTAI